MATRYHISQPDYPHTIADGAARLDGTPSQRVSPPAFGLVSFATGLPVKAAGEQINNTATPEVSFTGKARSGVRPTYSPGPTARARQPGVHSGTSSAKSTADLHEGTRSIAGPAAATQYGGAKAAQGPTRTLRRGTGTPPVMTSGAVSSFARRQAGVPSSPGKAARTPGGTRFGQAPRQAPAGKVPTVHAAVATGKRASEPNTIGSLFTPAPPKPAPVFTSAPAPARTSTPAPAPVAPVFVTRSGKGHF